MAHGSDIDAQGRGWHVPVRNVLVGMTAQAVLLAALAAGAIALLRATNPSAPPRSADTIDNDLGPWLTVAVLLVGAVPWLSLLITRAMGGVDGAGPKARTGAVVLWAILFCGVLGLAGLAWLLMALSAIVCPVDAYECPL